MKAGVLRSAMADPGDISALDELILGGMGARDIVAVTGQTEACTKRNLMARHCRPLHQPGAAIAERMLCVPSGGCPAVPAAPQVAPGQATEIASPVVKCEFNRRGQAPSRCHAFLDDTDASARCHIRGIVRGPVAGVLGDTRILVAGGAEHQGLDGGDLIAVVACRSRSSRRTSCAS